MCGHVAKETIERHALVFLERLKFHIVHAQSYLRLRLAFLVCDGANKFRPMTPADGVAPVMNLPAHLFSRMEYYMDGHKLSDLQDHIPQIDTIKNRLSKSKAWFSSVGARSCFWAP